MLGCRGHSGKKTVALTAGLSKLLLVASNQVWKCRRVWGRVKVAMKNQCGQAEGGVCAHGRERTEGSYCFLLEGRPLAVVKWVESG